MEPIRNAPATGSSGDNPRSLREYARPASTATTIRGYELVNDDKNAYDMTWDSNHTDQERLINRKRGAVQEEYPSGIKMAFIIVALVLSIFLFALDLVRRFTEA
jgi:hypothetical protein